uniref:FAD synthase n=1 Tax=Timema cristinae TaxID=61476 RepID=A0A7R9GUU1_TIMCR|nr:unnamed protein product [Timema cristinae]
MKLYDVTHPSQPAPRKRLIEATFYSITLGYVYKRVWNHGYYKVRVTVESDSQEELYKAYNKLLSVLEQGKSIFFRNKNLSAEICVYFDGSLESTVTLHLYYALLSKLSWNTKIQAMNVKDTKPSQQLETYIQETCDRYNLDICSFHCPVEEGITALVTKNRTIKVIIQGHRSSNQKTCEKIVETDSGSFHLLLVNPVTNWQDVDILDFIHSLSLPYCSLYDQGIVK